MDSLTHMATGALLGASVAQIAAPEALLPLTLLGLLAGSIPDIDFLSELKGKVAAWRYHRVAAHNIPVALSLSLFTAVIAQHIIDLPLPLLLLVCIIATCFHLFLDVLTSFGTCLLLPFNKMRFSFRSHFIIDPFVLIFSLLGVFSPHAPLFSGLLILYLLAGVLLRSLFTQYIQANLPKQLSHLNVHLEPAFMAPFRWLIIVKTDNGYAFCHQTLFWKSQWYVESDNNKHMKDICEKDTLMHEVLKTFDMPIYHQKEISGIHYLIIEDIKWRLEPGLRPLAFTAIINEENGTVYLSNVKQGSFFQRNDNKLFPPPIKLNDLPP